MTSIRFTTVDGPDGVIHPSAGVTLPEGEIEVAIQTLMSERPNSTFSESTFGWLLELAAEAERDRVNLPADIAENHDYYAHGKPTP